MFWIAWFVFLGELGALVAKRFVVIIKKPRAGTRGVAMISFGVQPPLSGGGLMAVKEIMRNLLLFRRELIFKFH